MSDSSDGKIIPLPERESVSELMRSKVEADGSLHLDEIQAELLLRYLIRVEMITKNYEALMAQIERLKGVR